MTNDGRQIRSAHHGSSDRAASHHSPEIGGRSHSPEAGSSHTLGGEAAIGLSSPRRRGMGIGVGAGRSSENFSHGNLVIPPLDGRFHPSPFADRQSPKEKSENPKHPQPGEDKPGVQHFKIDSAKSILELMKEPHLAGRFVHSASPADSNAPERQADKLKSGETPKISVLYADSPAKEKDSKEDASLDKAGADDAPKDSPKDSNDSSKEAAPKPDFIVKKDGTIEVVNNPEKNPDREIVIQVERPDGESGALPEVQQRSIDALSKYMADRVSQNPEYMKLSGGKFEFEDKHNLISEAAERSIKPGQDIPVPSIPPIPEDVQRISDEMNAIRNGGGSGDFSRGRIDDASGRREVPPPPDELPPVQAMKETLAAMFKPDEKEPYKTVRREHEAYRVGRYGMSGRNAGNWLSMMLSMDPELAAILGNPPDYSKLEEYFRKHPEKKKDLQAKMAAATKQGMQQLGKSEKVGKNFAAKFDDPEFANGFSDFIGKLGDPNAKQEEIAAGMKTFLPKELQETMNQQMVEHYAKQIVPDKNPDHLTPGDAGKVGLAMLLGRVPSQEDLANPNYTKYQQATENFYTLARAGQFGPGAINVSEHNQKLVAAARGNVGEQLWRQSPWAGVVEGGNLGCAASVSMVLKEMGIGVQGSAGVVELARQLRAAGYDQIPITHMNQYRPGDVVYGASGGGGGGNGHIGIIGEVTNGQVWQYDNSSSTGQWTHHTVQSGGSFVPGGRFGQGELFVLRRREVEEEEEE